MGEGDKISRTYRWVRFRPFLRLTKYSAFPSIGRKFIPWEFQLLSCPYIWPILVGSGISFYTLICVHFEEESAQCFGGVRVSVRPSLNSTSTSVHDTRTFEALHPIRFNYHRSPALEHGGPCPWTEQTALLVRKSPAQYCTATHGTCLRNLNLVGNPEAISQILDFSKDFLEIWWIRYTNKNLHANHDWGKWVVQILGNTTLSCPALTTYTSVTTVQ